MSITHGGGVVADKNTYIGYGSGSGALLVSGAGSRNIAEMKTGLEGILSPNPSVDGGIGQRWGGHSWSDTTASPTVKHAF